MNDRMSLLEFRAFLATQAATRPMARPTRRIQSEYDEQVLFFAVVEWFTHQYPERAGELEDVFSTSSGGKRSQAVAGRLKEAGQRRGVPDIEVWVPRGTWHGLTIELKPTKSGRVTPEQMARIERLNSRGYKAVVHHGWIAALSELCAYLDLPLPLDPEGVAATVIARRIYERRLARRKKRSQHQP